MIDINDSTERFWYWTYRYNDNDELAVLVAKRDSYRSFGPGILNSDVTRLIKSDKLIGVDVDRGFHPIKGTSSAEWKTWAAFQLCPVIEVYKVNTRDDAGLVLRWITLKL